MGASIVFVVAPLLVGGVLSKPDFPLFPSFELSCFELSIRLPFLCLFPIPRHSETKVNNTVQILTHIYSIEVLLLSILFSFFTSDSKYVFPP